MLPTDRAHTIRRRCRIDHWSRPDAAWVSYETVRLRSEVAEDIAIAQCIRERHATLDGNRTTLAEAAAEFAVELEAP